MHLKAYAIINQRMKNPVSSFSYTGRHCSLTKVDKLKVFLFFIVYDAAFTIFVFTIANVCNANFFYAFFISSILGFDSSKT